MSKWTAFLLPLTLLLSVAAAENLDARLFAYVHEDMRHPALDETVPALNELGHNLNVIGFAAALAATGALIDDDRLYDTGMLTLAAFAGTGLVSWSAKRIIRRPRPLTPEDARSMPSGHAAFAFAAATVLARQYPKLKVPAYVLATGTAFARVYLGRHYPSDVVVGATLGYGMARVVLANDAPFLTIRF